ncbi:MAG: hypothetical protein APR62_05215 [Smithella sp. SDB]|nr:MAG: hypothetical protein APR62_05215 [Smithella sp. SDB]
MKNLPEEGFVRLSQIIGNKDAPGVLPISRSSFLAGVREGRFPKPVKLGKRTTAWPVESIRALIKRESEQ